MVSKNGEKIPALKFNCLNTVVFHTKSLTRIKLFRAIFVINFEFKSYCRIFSTNENIDDTFETLRQRLHQNYHTRQIGHVGVTFPIGRLGVKTR